MNEIRIRAVMKRTGCGHELHTSFCRKQQSKIEVLYSMYVAFRSYFVIRDYAERIGCKIINITPGSFIDAFERMIPKQNDPGRIF